MFFSVEKLQVQDKSIDKKETPSLAFLVATSNSGKTIKRLLNSIDKLDYPRIKIYIQDNLSTDTTKTIIQEFKSKKKIIFSEKKDNGIYAAWNILKKKNNCDWHCFIGSDDVINIKEMNDFLNNHFLFLHKINTINLINGTTIYRDLDSFKKKQLIFGMPFIANEAFLRMSIANCSTFYRTRDFCNKKRYLKNYKIAGDYDFLLRNKSNIKAAFYPSPITQMDNKGISSQKFWRTIFETIKIIKINGASYFDMASYLLRAIFSKLKNSFIIK